MKGKLKTVGDFLRRADQFGVQLDFKHKGKEKHRTLVGAFFTLIVNTFIVYKLVTSIKDIILKDNLYFKIDSAPTKLDTIELKDFFMGICNTGALFENNTAFFDDADFFYFRSQFDNEIKPTNELMNLTHSSCGKIDKFDPGRTCRCLHFDNSTNYNLTGNIEEFFQSKIISVGMSIDFRKFEEKMYNNPMYNHYSIVLSNNYVNVTNYDQLSNPFITIEIELANVGSVTHLDYHYDKVQIDKVNDIYSFGVVEPYVESNFTYSLAKTSYRKYDGLENKVILNINVKHSNFVTKYTITTFSLESFLGNFGGYFQVIFVCFNFLAQLWNSESLDRKIVNSFIRDVSTVTKILDGLNDCSQNKQNIQVKIAQRENNISPNINIEMASRIHEEKRGGSSENASLVVDAPPFSPESNARKIHPDFVNNENNLKNARRITLYINQHYYKDLVTDFLDQFDFDRLYFLIKEFKLMQYFLLDADEIQWIKSLSKVPIKVEKLDEFIYKQSNAVSEQNEVFKKRLLDLKIFFSDQNNYS